MDGQGFSFDDNDLFYQFVFEHLLRDMALMSEVKVELNTKKSKTRSKDNRSKLPPLLTQDLTEDMFGKLAEPPHTDQ